MRHPAEERDEKRAALLARRRADGKDQASSSVEQKSGTRNEADGFDLSDKQHAASAGGGDGGGGDDDGDGESIDASAAPTTTAADADDAAVPSGDATSSGRGDMNLTPSGSVMVGYVRVSSGRITRGDKIYVLKAKHDPANPGEHCVQVCDALM
jgi:hypothetical protein